MAQRIIEWPARFAVAACEWNLIIPKLGSTSAFSGSQYSMILGPPRWTFTVDTADMLGDSLPEWEAFLRRMRQGLNLVRAWDWRYTGQRTVYNGGSGRAPGNLLPASTQLASWSRVGPAGVPEGSGVVVSYTSDYFQSSAVQFVAHVVYVLAIDVRSEVSAQVALSLDSRAFGVASGAIFDAVNGSTVSQYGAVQTSANVPLAGGGYRIYVTAKAVQPVIGLVHAYPVLPAGGVTSVKLDRPQLAYAINPLPPPYVATVDGQTSWMDIEPRVHGGGQTGDTLSTRGWIPGLALKEGFWISYGDGMHQLIDNAQVDDLGRADLWIEPPIRLSPPDGQPISFRRVTGLFRLKSDVGFRQENVLVPGISLSFEEDFNDAV